MKLSFIIPVYNGASTIGRCLDSIYSQGLDASDFEVICVDDCSPDAETVRALNEYQHQDRHPDNLRIIRHTENRRQGGARNTAIDAASGEYIQCIDQDDTFTQGCLPQMLTSLNQHPGIDIIVNDSVYVENGKVTGPFHTWMDSEVHTGHEFLRFESVSWDHWSYCIRTDFLRKKNIRFAERTRFESVDFTLKIIAKADSICYIPIIKVRYNLSDAQTCRMGGDYLRLKDLTECRFRMRLLAEEVAKENPQSGQIIMGHHQFSYNVLLSRYLWKLGGGKIISLIKQYPPATPSKFPLLNFAAAHPRLYAGAAQMVKPLLSAAMWIRKQLR